MDLFNGESGDEAGSDIEPIPAGDRGREADLGDDSQIGAAAWMKNVSSSLESLKASVTLLNNCCKPADGEKRHKRVNRIPSTEESRLALIVQYYNVLVSLHPLLHTPY